jgi:hypothetical protein
MRQYWLIGVLAVLVGFSTAGAMITGATLTTSGQTVQLVDPSGFNSNGDLVLTERVSGAGARVDVTNVVTDVPGDPLLWLLKSVENASSFDWTGYLVYIHAELPFSVAAVEAMTGWTYSYDPVALGPDGYATTIKFTANPGVKVAVGDWGDFNMRLQFPEPEEFWNVQTPLPEPATLVFLALGGLFIRRARRQAMIP